MGSKGRGRTELLLGQMPGSALAPGAVQQVLLSQVSAEPLSNGRPSLWPCLCCAREAGEGSAWHARSVTRGEAQRAGRKADEF